MTLTVCLIALAASLASLAYAITAHVIVSRTLAQFN